MMAPQHAALSENRQLEAEPKVEERSLYFYRGLELEKADNKLQTLLRAE